MCDVWQEIIPCISCNTIIIAFINLKNVLCAKDFLKFSCVNKKFRLPDLSYTETVLDFNRSWCICILRHRFDNYIAFSRSATRIKSRSTARQNDVWDAYFGSNVSLVSEALRISTRRPYINQMRCIDLLALFFKLDLYITFK